jgi:hypothetical protein
MAILVGVSTTITFDGKGCLFRYSNAAGVHPLHRALGERYIPVSALRRVEWMPPQRGVGVLRMVLWPGADPLLAQFSDDLAERLDPYRIEFDFSRQAAAAAQLHDLVAHAIYASTARPGCGFLLSALPPPRRVRGVDGRGEFDGHLVKLTWGPMARTDITAGGPTRVIPLSIVDGVEWSARHLRIRVAGSGEVNSDPRQDPNALLLAGSMTSEAEAILFAAAVYEALATRPGSVVVHSDAGAVDDRDFAATAERSGEHVGEVRVRTPSTFAELREIDQ